MKKVRLYPCFFDEKSVLSKTASFGKNVQLTALLLSQRSILSQQSVLMKGVSL